MGNYLSFPFPYPLPGSGSGSGSGVGLGSDGASSLAVESTLTSTTSSSLLSAIITTTTTTTTTTTSAAAAMTSPPPLSPHSASHPYYPPGADIPGYVPNAAPVWALLVSMAGMLGGALVAACVVAARLQRRRPLLDRRRPARLAVFCWFVMCGCLHCFFEGYFIFNHATLASSQNLFAQLWKEYALSDSRYLTSDPFMLSVESITVFIWGPLCLLCAALTVYSPPPPPAPPQQQKQGRQTPQEQDHPLLHPARAAASLAHLYGVALYYATCGADALLRGRAHSRPEALYFWVYYVGFNMPWVVVPGVLLYNSVKATARTMRALERVDETLRAHRDLIASDSETVESKKDL